MSNTTNDNRDDILYIRSKEFIDSLRKEASDAKSCVTQYTFQSLVISGAALSFIVSSSKDDPRSISTIAAIPMILILMVMMRIAVYKYEIANRAYGYELHLKTISNLFWKKDAVISTPFEKDVKYWKFVVENEDWERNYFVWRIVYPTLFGFYYHINFHDKIINFLDIKAYELRETTLASIKSAHEENNRQSETTSMTGKKISSIWLLSRRKLDTKNEKNKADFHAGGYLAKMLNVILAMQFFLAIPLFFSYWNLTKEILNKAKSLQMHEEFWPNSFPKDISEFNPVFFVCLVCVIIIILFLAHHLIASTIIEKIEKKGSDFYLQSTILPISITIFFLVLILFIVQVSIHSSLGWKISVLLFVASIGIVLFTYFCFIMTLRILRRNEILETGFNSIRSSSLLWSIVFEIHYKSWHKAQKDINDPIKISKAILFDFEERYKFHVFEETERVIKENF
jgi:hypothetical protein